ncbi:hypothetical protein C8R47DRAFT_95011 [Mycena vitilis]|nr:hypothetical protein C8R47DRAFT_95011 [Mycena vitilis]
MRDSLSFTMQAPWPLKVWLGCVHQTRYRLGIPQGQEAEKRGALNLGLRNHIAALQWVQLHTEAFGGGKETDNMHLTREFITYCISQCIHGSPTLDQCGRHNGQPLVFCLSYKIVGHWSSSGYKTDPQRRELARSSGLGLQRPFPCSTPSAIRLCTNGCYHSY